MTIDRHKHPIERVRGTHRIGVPPLFLATTSCTSLAVALILAGCKFPELPDIEDAPIDDGAIDGSVSIDSATDSATDSTPRGPLVSNNQPADIVYGQPNFTSNTIRGVTSNGITYPKVAAAGGASIWVTDSDNSRVLAFSSAPPGVDPDATLVLGRTSFTDASTVTTPTASVIKGPFGAAIAGAMLVVSDFGFNRVLIWNGIPSANGAPASLVLGQQSFSTSASGTSAAEMSSPTHVWTDGTRLVVADPFNHRVLVWTSFPTANGQAADLVLGQAAFGDSSQPASPTASRVKSPGAIAWDGARLYIADGGHNRVLVWNGFPAQSGEAADAVIGQPDFVTQGGEGSGPQRFNSPGGLLVVDGALLVSDSGNHRILVFDPAPVASRTDVSSATQVLGQPDTLTTGAQTPSQTSLLSCRGLSLRGDDLFVTDGSNHRVLRFDLALP